MLSAACLDLARELAVALTRMNRHDVTAQLDRLMIVSQRLTGTPSVFSFAAYPIPKLTYEERVATTLRDWEDIRIPVRGGCVTVALDDFGQCNFVYVEGLPEVYAALKTLKGYIGTEEDLPPDVRERLEAQRKTGLR